MQDKRLMWFKGQLVPPHKAKVEVLSPTAQFGLNVFEGIRGYWSQTHQKIFLFRLEEHLKRLYQSCHLIGINCPYDSVAVKQAIFDTITANKYKCDIALRVTVFVDGEGSWSSCEPVDMFIAPVAKARRDLSNTAGMRASVSSWERISDRALPPRIKAGANYINGRYAHLETQRKNHDLPILMTREGNIAEGAGSCLFMVRDGILITPPLTDSILESITRVTLLILAKELGIPTEVRSINRSELMLADEIFLCGSAAELTPISVLDGLTVGRGLRGSVTTQLTERYLNVADGSTEAFGIWRTPTP